jgi:leucyl/phenylalanyl-tRNA---protein transferase
MESLLARLLRARIWHAALMIRIPILRPGANEEFPDVELALKEPNGLLCAGGDLSSERLLRAYSLGIFPWFNPGEPILWWSPDPRCVFDLATLRPSRSLRRFAKTCHWQITSDRNFDEVIRACAAPRDDEAGTWISAEMHSAYLTLHRLGYAHSIEIWHEGNLIGGLYGIALGHVFFGESMFSRQSNASKIALFALARQLLDWGFVMIDGQVINPHLIGLGALMIPRSNFVRLLDRHCNAPFNPAGWSKTWQIYSAKQLI